MVYDSIIIGGGPAGLSAALYLGRFNRSVLVLDKETGRSSYPQVNENYLGFLDGIHANDLRKIGRLHAEKYGAVFNPDEILSLKKQEDTFLVKGANDYVGKTLILATGVVDIFPQFPDMQEYVGKSLFWCITCDGYKTIDKQIIVVGHTNEAIITCLQFLIYTKKISFLLNCAIDQAEISQEMKQRLADHHIPFIEGVIKKVEGKNGYLDSVVLHDGRLLEADLLFNQQGAVPNSVLSQDLGVRTDKEGYILTDLEQRTNIPNVYAAGDVTKSFSHQIVTAVHEGSMAAQAANYDLYEPYQKE